jgi:hypothetical protein
VSAAISIVTPLPSCCTDPEPEIGALTDTVSDRSKTSLPFTVTAPLPSVPVMPPLPTCSVPAWMVVLPL